MRSDIKKPVWLGSCAAGLALCAVLNQGVLHPLWVRNYAPKNLSMASGLAPDQMLLAVAGFREMVASILWVRADTYFDQGNYDAVLPIIRMVTWLDPKQIDVYSTGMWHIGYNFTDEQSRSDRRYLPSALALGAEGAKNNDETYEMYFETGWMWFHKINDQYENAVTWFERAGEKSDIPPARRNMLISAYQRSGQLDKALKLYYDQLNKAELAMKASQGQVTDFTARQQRDTVEKNLDVFLVRMSQRGNFKADGTATELYDTQPPFDVGFGTEVSVVAPAVLRVRATWNVRPIGTRIRVILRDADYPNGTDAGMDFSVSDSVNLDPPKNLTFMQDELFIRNRRADKKMDMSRDPTMYTFSKEKYYLDFYYNPRSAPPHIQDRFGFLGEGMTDKSYLNTTARKGERVIFHRMELTRDMLKREGEWIDKMPILRTPNFVEGSATRNAEEELIKVPGLLNK